MDLFSRNFKEVNFLGHPCNLELDLPPNPFTQPSTEKLVHNMKFWGKYLINKPKNKYSQQKPTCKHKNLTPASTVLRTGSPDWSEPDWSHLHYQLVRQVQSPLALKPLKMLCDRIQIQCLCGFNTVECK